MLLQFKSGAFVPGQPVVPITWRYNCGPDLLVGWVWQQPPESSLWRGVPRDLMHLMRIISCRNKVVEARPPPRSRRACGPAARRRVEPSHLVCQPQVIVLPPHVPTEAEKQDPALFAANVRREMARALRVPEQCPYAVDDARAFYSSIDAEYKKTS